MQTFASSLMFDGTDNKTRSRVEEDVHSAAEKKYTRLDPLTPGSKWGRVVDPNVIDTLTILQCTVTLYFERN